MNKSITLMMIIAGAISWSSVAEGWHFANKSSYTIAIVGPSPETTRSFRPKTSGEIKTHAEQFTIYSFPANGKIELKTIGQNLGIVYGKVDSNGNMKSPKTLVVVGIANLENLGIAIDVGVVTGFKVGYYDKSKSTNPTALQIIYGN